MLVVGDFATNIDQAVGSLVGSLGERAVPVAVAATLPCISH